MVHCDQRPRHHTVAITHLPAAHRTESAQSSACRTVAASLCGRFVPTNDLCTCVKSTAVATLRCGRRTHINDLSVPINSVYQSVGHRAPVVLLCLHATDVQCERHLSHN